jgi:hypothetical protein
VTDLKGRSDTLRIALWVAVIALLAAVPPIWPYGFCVLLRLAVTSVSIYAIVALETSRLDTIPLALAALLFNPVVPVHLPKAMWAIIDLGTAAFLWSLINRRLVRSVTASG